MPIRILKLSFNSLLDNLDSIKDYYLSGDVIIIKKFKPKLIDLTLLEDAALDGSIDPNHPSIKKGHSGVISKACEPFSNSRQLKLEQQMKECENIVGKLFIILLSRAGAKSTTCTNASTWRFVPTHNEPYHLDDYGATVLRAFWNLSDKPRVWRIGHNALDIANMHKEKYIEFVDKHRLLEKKCCDFQVHSNRYLGHKAKIIQKKDKYQISFDKHDLWICDSLKVCHEIVSGDKMVAFSFEPRNPNTFYDPETIDRLEYKNWMVEGLCFQKNLKDQEINKL